MWRDLRRSMLVLLLVLLVCAGCGGAAPPAVTPSPTIAAAALQPSSPSGASPAAATRVPTPRPSAALPTAASSAASAQLASTAEAFTFVYLWPAYLPAGMQVSPTESRIAREGELGQGGIGFFIVTFKAGTRRLVIGGGSTETLPLTGEQRRISVGTRQATLTTNDDQRQIVFDVPQGSLFVYGFGLSQEELLRVAESLQPIDVREMRARAGVE